MLLPQELFDIIVQQIGDDSNTLSACLLTCSGLAAPARARIFSTVRLTPPALRSRTTTRCQKFYSLVTSNPHLALLVKDLQIVEGNDRDFESGAVWVVKASRTLSLILPLLSLKRLSIQANPKLEWERLSRSFRAALKDVLCSPQLEVLRLRGIVLNAPSDLYDLLSMVTEIKALKGLSLSYKLRSSLATAISIPPGWRPQLQSLAFSDHYTSGHFARMLSTSNVDFSRLRSLSCSGLHSSHINALLKALPPQNVLESLNIWYPPSFTATEPHHHEELGFASFPRLRSLRIRSPFGLSFFREILEECAHTGVEKIVFEGVLKYQFLDSTQCDPFLAAVRHSPAATIKFLVNDQAGLETVLKICGLALETALGPSSVLELRGIYPPTSLSTYEDAHLLE